MFAWAAESLYSYFDNGFLQLIICSTLLIKWIFLFRWTLNSRNFPLKFCNCTEFLFFFKHNIFNLQCSQAQNSVNIWNLTDILINLENLAVTHLKNIGMSPIYFLRKIENLWTQFINHKMIKKIMCHQVKALSLFFTSIR